MVFDVDVFVKISGAVASFIAMTSGPVIGILVYWRQNHVRLEAKNDRSKIQETITEVKQSVKEVKELSNGNSHLLNAVIGDAAFARGKLVGADEQRENPTGPIT